MSSEWGNESTIGQLIADFGGSIKTGPFGTTLKASEYVSEGVPLISVREIGHGSFHIDSKTPRVSPETTTRLSEYLLEAGDIVFARKGGIERCSLVQKAQAGWFLGSDGIRLRPPKNCDARFLAYSLQTQTVKDWLTQHSTGSTMASLNQATIARLQICIPAIDEQRKIAGCLEALDDRIALLRETNATLEAIAQALFKSWFVDFDPAHAKQQGRAPEGMDEATAALFPDSFEESELGLVPRVWRIGGLSDLATYLNGYAFKTKDWQETGHPVVKIGNVKPGIIDVAGATCVSSEVIVGLERFRLKRGDLLVGMTGYVGETGLVTEIEPAAYLNQRVGKISTEEGINDLGFVYCLVRNPAYKAHAEAQSHGSAQANVSGTDLMSYVTVLPDSEVLDAFNQVLAGLICKILGNHEQSQTLATLRDTLLPRLISGQLRLPEAEALLESA